jgi:hypothetical protein
LPICIMLAAPLLAVLLESLTRVLWYVYVV